MAVELGKGVITGVTTATNDTDLAYKEYADNKPGYALTTIVNDSDFYKGSVSSPGGTTAIGISSSFQYTCYTSSGCYNYPIDSSATNLNIYITSAGGGGSASSADFASNTSLGFNWSSPSGYMEASGWSYGCLDFADNGTRIAGIPLATGYAVQTSDDGGMDWSVRTFGSPYGTRGLIYANNLWVSAGCYQHMMVSTDAINWAMRTTACQNSVNFGGIAYGNGVWFAPGCQCTSQSSTDTIHWTLRTIAHANSLSQMQYRNVVFGGGQFLLSTYYQYLQTSTDAIHWTLRTRGHAWTCTNSARYIDNEFLLVDQSTSGAFAIKSTDAIHWDGSGNLSAVRGSCGAFDITKINNGKQYLVTGDGGARVSTSTDFLHWNICCVQDCGIFGGCSGSCSFNYCWFTVYKSNLTNYPNRYFMSGYGYNQMAISDIEASGISGGGGSAGQSFMYSLSLENVSKKEGLRVCVGSGGKGEGVPWNSLAGWTQRTALPTGCRIYDMEFNDGKFLGVGVGKLLTASTDAINWSLRTLGDVSTACDLRSVIYDGAGWLVTGHTNANNGSSGSLSASTDSIHWTQRTTGIPDDHRQIMYHDGKKTYFMNSIGCSAASSTDAIHWTLRTLPFGILACCGSLSCSGDYYIATSTYSSHGYTVSTDAIHWFLRTTGVSETVYGVGYIHPNYVASFYSTNITPRVSSSTDSIHWTKRTGTTAMWNDITLRNPRIFRYANGYLHYLGDNAANSYQNVTTTDGIHWVNRPVPFSGIVNADVAFAYGNGKYVRSLTEDGQSGCTDVCITSFDASGQNGGTTSVLWNEGLPANAKGCIYPLEIATTGGTPPTAASASYCFDPVGSEAAVLDYNSSVFRLSDSDTTAVDDFTVEFWFRTKADAGNPALQTIFALGESNENGFLSLKHTGSTLCYYYKTTGGTTCSEYFTTANTNTWYHVALEYSASTGCFGHYMDGARVNLNNVTSYKPAVYGDRLRIGSLYNTDCSLTSLTDQGAFNGEITNFRISNSLRYNATSYTVPTPDFTPDTNTVFLTGRGESLNGTLSCQCLVGPTVSGGIKGTLEGADAPSFDATNPRWMYDNAMSGSPYRTFKTPNEQSGNCDYRKGLSGGSTPGATTCLNCCAYGTPTGGGGGGFSNGGNDNGRLAKSINLFCNSTSGSCKSNFPDFAGFGSGGKGGDIFVNGSPGEFTKRQVNTTTPYCVFFGTGHLNGYYFGSNQASTDTIHWVLRTVSAQASPPNYSGTGFIAQSDSEALLYTCDYRITHTTDTIHWTLRTVPFPSGTSSGVQSVRYLNNNKWAITGCNKLMTISTDTIHWTLRTAGGCSGSNPKIHGMVYGNGIYMAAGHCCQYIATSTDSISWTLRTRSTSMNSDSTNYTPAFGNGMFVITSYQSFGYSTDAIHWFATCIPNTNYKYSICYNKCINQFLSAGYCSYVYMSGDGISWSCVEVHSEGSTAGRSVNVLGPANDLRMLYTNCNCQTIGFLNTAPIKTGFFGGSEGGRGAGGGGGGFYSPTRSATTGGDGGDGYVRINWK